MRCPCCGSTWVNHYDLNGLTEHRCWECGHRWLASTYDWLLEDDEYDEIDEDDYGWDY